MDDVGLLAQRLGSVLAEALGVPGAQIRDLRRLTGGASRETWSFETRIDAAETRRLVLRRDPPGQPREDGIALEVRAITAASRAGVPEPEIIVHGDDTERLGAPFMVMEWLPGETVARRILRDDRYADVRPRLAASCGDILARIHGIAPEEVPGLGAEDPVVDLRAQLASFAEPSPVFELGLHWLDAHRPHAPRQTVVHGDFRNGNLLIDPDGVRAVLDWELVHRGDPMEDLGWLCVRAWRFGSDKPVGGFGTRDELFAAYERTGGHPVDPQAVLWWEVHGTVWWGITCMKMCAEHLTGELRSVERAAIGRRAWEQEYDTMLLLEDRLGRL